MLEVISEVRGWLEKADGWLKKLIGADLLSVMKEYH